MAALSAQTKIDVAKAIWSAELIRIQETVLANGTTSPYYIDLRRLQSHPAEFKTIINAFAEILKGSDDSIFLAGIPEAATPLASALGYETGRRLVQPRKVIKDHGTKSSVEGDYKDGDRVILVDDLMNDGGSKLEIVDQIEGTGLVIEKFVVLVDRERGGPAKIREAGYEIEAGITITEVLTILHDEKSISEADYNTIITYTNSFK